MDLCEERDATGATVTRRFFGQGEQRIGGADAGSYYYAGDHLGNVTELTDATGAVRARYEYSPYGSRVKTGGDLETDRGFTGHVLHAATGLYITPTRLYDPGLGRWLSRDPVGESGGLNLYAYVGCDPINRVDPSGLSWTGLAINVAVGLAVAAVLAALIPVTTLSAVMFIGAVSAWAGDLAMQLYDSGGQCYDAGQGVFAAALGALTAGLAKMYAPAIAAALNRSLSGAAKAAMPTVDRVRQVAQQGFEYAVQNPRVPGLNRMQLGKDAEVQATRWMRRWAERSGVELGPGGLQFQVRGAHSVPDVVYEPAMHIFDFKLTPKAVKPAQHANFQNDFPAYSIEYIFGNER